MTTMMSSLSLARSVKDRPGWRSKASKTGDGAHEKARRGAPGF
jgi:hypothetical protein